MKWKPLFFPFLLLVSVVWGQRVPSTVSEVTLALSTQLSVYPQEKVYVHTDKDFYRGGDTL